MSEFLPKARWRERSTPKRVGRAVAATFASIVLCGAALLWLLDRLLDWMDAPGWVIGLVWVLLIAISTLWALFDKTPATTSDLEYQPWTEFVIRSVMVGSGSARSLPLRVITGVLFGAPLGCYLIVFFALAVTGLV